MPKKETKEGTGRVEGEEATRNNNGEALIYLFFSRWWRDNRKKIGRILLQKYMLRLRINGMLQQVKPPSPGSAFANALILTGSLH